ncbi:MAG: hypothetical protein AB1813_02775 [Verrucomicrobiota bacterium]
MAELILLPKFFAIFSMPDCGGWTSATPLWPIPNALVLPTRAAEAKAPSPLRSAGALHKVAADVTRVVKPTLILECGGKAEARHRFGQFPTHRIY